MIWVYRATKKVAPFNDTKILANSFGFLCRTAYNSVGHWNSSVRKVALGDTIYLYYTDHESPEVGAYEVVQPEVHKHSEFFGQRVGDSALHEVRESKLLVELKRLARYASDKKVGTYTGWPVRLLDQQAPAFDPGRMTGTGTLRRY